MSFQPPALRRSLFGYSKEQVNRVLAEREALVRLSEGRLRSGESRISDLEGQLAELRQEMERREAASQSSARFLTEELATILSAAEESATRIIERARISTQQQIQEANRLWREVQAEVSRFAAWREKVDPAIRTTQSKLEDVRNQVMEVPERIRRALAPMAEAIAAMDADLNDLGAAASPPLLLAPTGLEEAASGGSPRPDEGQPEQTPLDEATSGGDAEWPTTGDAEKGESSPEVSRTDRDPRARHEEDSPWRSSEGMQQASRDQAVDAGGQPLPAADYLPPTLGIA